MAALTGQRDGAALLASIGAIVLEQTALSTTTYPTLAYATEVLNQTYRQVLRQHPWLWAIDEVTKATTANTKTVVLDDAVERIIGIQIQGSSQAVRYVPRNRLMLEFPGGWSSIGAGIPTVWTDAEGATNNALQIDLFPTPNDALTLTIQCQKRPAAITNSSSSYSIIPPEWEDALIYGTVAELFAMLSDNRASFYASKYQETMARMWLRDEQNLDGVQSAMIGGGVSMDTWRPYRGE